MSQRQRQQSGGAKSLPDSALAGAQVWRAEVKAVQAKTGVSYKEAMSLASAERQKKAGYATSKARYASKLSASRKVGTTYRPSGSKNKRPLSLAASQRILLNYYRDNKESFGKNGPLAALRKDIGSCRPKGRTLTPCPANIKTKAQAKGHACADSWKYRPGTNSKSATGPGQYDMAGLDNLCGQDNLAARKASKLYNMKFMHKKVKVAGPTVTNPLTGRKIRQGGATHKALIAKGKMQ